ncbi:hypothetical protein F5Y12DRAFT_789128 [Xylaria sp. FL1777]|nr:hypothetical protein F5Y12DRAFT_789128 [Xylaria sp. FL1777]
MSSSRYVDAVPVPAPGLIREKKVPVLSYSRSGTLGLRNAIEFLSYKPYIMGQVVRNGYHHPKMFSEALSIKRTGLGRSYSRTDFDKWVWNYDEIVVEAYPDVKFILTEREPDGWATSIWNFFKYFDAVDLQYRHGRTEAGFQAAMTEYEEYNERVKALVPADRQLVARVEHEFGWGEICPFLEVDIPTTPYPRINDTKQFQAHSTRMMQSERRAVSLLGAQATFAVGFWYIRR